MHLPMWLDFAACRGMDTDLFFPSADQQPAEAVEVCKGCPVIVQCGDYAEQHNLTDGVWGGRSAYERKQARKAARQAA